MNVRNSVAVSRFVSPLRIVLAIAGGLLFASASACSSNDAGGTGDGTSAQTCKAGSTVACTCADGASGTEACGSTTCTCASAPVDGGSGPIGTSDSGTSEDTGVSDTGTGNGDGGHLHDSGPTASDAAAGTYGADCKVDTDCTDPVYNACFVGGNRSFCTKHCATAADCPTPPTVGQCNKQLYCK